MLSFSPSQKRARPGDVPKHISHVVAEYAQNALVAFLNTREFHTVKGKPGRRCQNCRQLTGNNVHVVVTGSRDCLVISATLYQSVIRQN